MLPFFIVVIAIVVLIPLDPDVRVGDFEPTPYTGKANPSPDYIVQDHYFQSGDTTCHAWLYLPLGSQGNNDTTSNTTATTTTSNATLDPSSQDVIKNEPAKDNNNKKLPVIIMASGFAEQKDFGFDVYAERFVVDHGFAVFLFDYRSFGASEGRPRNWVSPKRHLQDWNAAIDYIHSFKQQHPESLPAPIDPNKIGLWGMSFAGGHVLTVAATRPLDYQKNDTSIVAVVAQAPFLKPKASTSRSSKKRGRLGKLRLVLAALQDAARGYLGLSPVVIPILGIKGSGQLCMMPSTPQAMETYQTQQHPPLGQEKLGGWINQGPVRSLFELKHYNPLETIRQNPPQIPVLLVSGSRDAICPASAIEEVHNLLPKSRVITRNASHVEIMGPKHAPQVGRDMGNFFAESFR